MAFIILGDISPGESDQIHKIVGDPVGILNLASTIKTVRLQADCLV